MAEAVQLSDKRAAVTGGAGFIGAAVSRRLVAEGCEVTGLEVDPALAPRVEETGA
ncbi:MAG: NAD-dependent epimerase/dehydratase family protein, partial [Solirubrobacterales bacterium]